MPDADKRTQTFGFRLGLWLVACGMISGIPVAAIGTVVGMLTGQPLAGLIAGIAMYALSWLMVGAGIFLAGPAALAMARGTCRDFVRSCRHRKDHSHQSNGD